MNVSELFTMRGLVTALKEHHKNLHANHSFPPLTGAKPLHRFAELFSLKGAEQLEYELNKLEVESVQAANINLFQEGFCQQITVYTDPDFSSDENHTIRVQMPGCSDFLITSVDFDVMKHHPFVFYSATNKAVITFGYVQVVVELDLYRVSASLYENTMKEPMDSDGDDIDNNPNVIRVDYQSTETDPDTELYAKQVRSLIGMISKRHEVSDKFITQCLEQGLSTLQAVNFYYYTDTIARTSYVFYPTSQYGYWDLDVRNNEKVSRVKMPVKPKEGDIFNGYYGESSKCGIEWKGDLETSLVALKIN